MPHLDISKIFILYRTIDSEGKLFPSEFQYEMFLKRSCKAIRENAEIFNRLEVQVVYIVSHSNHKEKITIVSSGCTIFPPVVEICPVTR